MLVDYVDDHKEVIKSLQSYGECGKSIQGRSSQRG